MFSEAHRVPPLLADIVDAVHSFLLELHLGFVASRGNAQLVLSEGYQVFLLFHGYVQLNYPLLKVGLGISIWSFHTLLGFQFHKTAPQL